MRSREGLAWAAMGEWSGGGVKRGAQREAWASGGHTKQTARRMSMDLRELLEKYIYAYFLNMELSIYEPCLTVNGH